ncbi:ExeA family protein [Anatilimnocola sp. NA78]|uniref:ExeA family protein n=1 Tax=Anatilimnocola sp. NA78 TaxID=3415683 RepID=UPI003CE49439
MYEAHWQLNARPFDHTADARFYYPGESQQGALLKLRYAVEMRQPAALLAGPAGVGKTTLIQTLLRQCGDALSPRLNIVFPQLPSDQLLIYLAGQLSEARSQAPETLEQSLRRLETVLGDNARAGKHALVIIDEAHLLAANGGLETVRLLLNLQYAGRPLATLLLIGQTGLLVSIERTPNLEERFAVKCLLRRLTLTETMAYVQHRLQAAGVERQIFSDAALEAVHQHSLGVPRRVNRLCDLALLVGFAEEATSIDAAQIEAISEELLTSSAE